jgi:hypothetical protein
VRIRAAYYHLEALAYVVDLVGGTRVVVPREVAGDEYRDEDIRADGSIPAERAERILRLGLFDAREPREDGKPTDPRDLEFAHRTASDAGWLGPGEIVVRGPDGTSYLARPETEAGNVYRTVGVLALYDDRHPCGWLRVPMFAVNRWPDVGCFLDVD